MAARRGRKGTRRRKKTRVAKKRSGRRAGRTRSSRSARRRPAGHKKVSVQRLQTLLPDIAVCKLGIAGVIITHGCIEWNENLYFVPTSPTSYSNGFVVALNCNPSGGIFAYSKDQAFNAQFNPVQTYMTKYKRYRCHGTKLTIDVIYADEAGEDTLANVIARPFQITGFPFQISDSNMANYWAGANTNGYNASTIPIMKYGFRRISSGLGGKVKVTYKTYWPMAKLFGLTEQQFMADTRFCSFPQAGVTPPSLQGFLACHISDYNPNQIRVVSINVKATQYGRWEGQQADYS